MFDKSIDYKKWILECCPTWLDTHAPMMKIPYGLATPCDASAHCATMQL